MNIPRSPAANSTQAMNKKFFARKEELPCSDINVFLFLQTINLEIEEIKMPRNAVIGISIDGISVKNNLLLNIIKKIVLGIPTRYIRSEML